MEIFLELISRDILTVIFIAYISYTFDKTIRTILSILLMMISALFIAIGIVINRLRKHCKLSVRSMGPN